MRREDMLRSQRDAVHTALMPNLPRPLLLAAARALGMMHQGEPVYRDTQQLAVCTDLALYGLPEGVSLLRAFVLARDDVDATLRDAMPRAVHVLAEVATVEPEGVAVCVSVQTGETLRLFDPQLSQSSMVGAFVSTHVIPLPGVYITTGAPLLIHPDIVEKVRGRSDLRGASLASSLALTQWSYVPQASAPSQPTKKTGRNAPCPCGSGRRYKACHGRRR